MRRSRSAIHSKSAVSSAKADQQYRPIAWPFTGQWGPTLTHMLLPGSPAINGGDPNFTPPPSYDQRGSPFVRVFNGRIDIGSFEVQPPRRPTPAPRSRPTPR